MKGRGQEPYKSLGRLREELKIQTETDKCASFDLAYKVFGEK